MTEASKRRRATARHEAQLTGRPWESERSRKRRLKQERQRSENGARLLETAAAFAKRDDGARRITRVRIMRATGDGGKVERKDAPCLTYNESARRIMGY